MPFWHFPKARPGYRRPHFAPLGLRNEGPQTRPCLVALIALHLRAVWHASGACPQVAVVGRSTQLELQQLPWKLPRPGSQVSPNSTTPFPHTGGVPGLMRVSVVSDADGNGTFVPLGGRVPVRLAGTDFEGVGAGGDTAAVGVLNAVCEENDVEVFDGEIDAEAGNVVDGEAAIVTEAEIDAVIDPVLEVVIEIEPEPDEVIVPVTELEVEMDTDEDPEAELDTELEPELEAEEVVAVDKSQRCPMRLPLSTLPFNK